MFTLTVCILECGYLPTLQLDLRLKIFRLEECIKNNTGRGGYCATISEKEMANIHIALDSSRLMALIKKKKFGIRK